MEIIKQTASSKTMTGDLVTQRKGKKISEELPSTYSVEEMKQFL